MTSSAPASAATSETRTRVWVGLVMAAAAAGILVVDHLIERSFGLRLYPFLFVSVAAVSLTAANDAVPGSRSKCT